MADHRPDNRDGDPLANPSGARGWGRPAGYNPGFHPCFNPGFGGNKGSRGLVTLYRVAEDAAMVVMAASATATMVDTKATAAVVGTMAEDDAAVFGTGTPLLKSCTDLKVN